MRNLIYKGSNIFHTFHKLFRILVILNNYIDWLNLIFIYGLLYLDLSTFYSVKVQSLFMLSVFKVSLVISFIASSIWVNVIFSALCWGSATSSEATQWRPGEIPETYDHTFMRSFKINVIIMIIIIFGNAIYPLNSIQTYLSKIEPF